MNVYKKAKTAVVLCCLLAVCTAFLPAVGGVAEDQGTAHADAVRAYRSVLAGESGFYSAKTTYGIGEGDWLLQDYLTEAGGVVHQFTVVDMDGDDMFEVVLSVEPHYNLVLHYEAGVVYGYLFSNREVQEIYRDGTFSWSAGAGDNGLARAVFSADRQELVITEEFDPDIIRPPVGADVLVDWYDYTRENVDGHVR